MQESISVEMLNAQLNPSYQRGEITGGKVWMRPLTQFKEGAVLFKCCKCTHHLWVQFSVNAKNVDEDAANHFLVEKDQDGIKISINHQESEITEQRISQSPTIEITQKNGVILHYWDVYNKRVRTSKVKDYICDKIQNGSYFLIGKNCQNFCVDLLKYLDLAQDRDDYGTLCRL